MKSIKAIGISKKGEEKIRTKKLQHAFAFAFESEVTKRVELAWGGYVTNRATLLPYSVYPGLFYN